MHPRATKPNNMSKQRPLKVLTFILILFALSHLPSFAREHADTEAKPTERLFRSEVPTYNLEMRWGLHNFHERICRVHNACLNKHGLAVHPWMKVHQHHLQSCGVKNVTYLNPAQKPLFRPLDLFGVVPARYHIPHFLTDVLPMVYASSLLKERLAADVRAVCETPRRGRCRPASVTAALLVEDRAKKLPDEAWVKQLSHILPGHPRLIIPEEGCYRSVIAYRRTFFRRGRRWYSKGELFEKAGISRESVMGKCTPHVVVLNRVGWVRRGGILLGRDIVNVDEVVKEIGQKARDVGLNVTTEVAYFENRTFTEQVKIMQRADVLLGVHGAGLGNLLFAKQDVPLLEVLPFSYYAGPFDKLASSLYLNYSRIVAEPDEESFLDCLKKRAEKAEKMEEFEEDKETWKKAVEEWRESGESFLQTHLLKGERNTSMKICARGQRLRVDPKETAERLLKMAGGICRRKRS